MRPAYLERHPDNARTAILAPPTNGPESLLAQAQFTKTPVPLKSHPRGHLRTSRLHVFLGFPASAASAQCGIDVGILFVARRPSLL